MALPTKRIRHHQRRPIMLIRQIFLEHRSIFEFVAQRTEQAIWAYHGTLVHLVVQRRSMVDAKKALTYGALVVNARRSAMKASMVQIQCPWFREAPRQHQVQNKITEVIDAPSHPQTKTPK